MLLPCSRCNKELPEEDFPINRTKHKRNLRGNTCLACQREYKKTLNYPPCDYPFECTVCGEEKPAEEFSKNKRVPRGRNSTCRPCKTRQSITREASSHLRSLGITSDPDMFGEKHEG